jgi:hypothetical protein
LAERAPTLPRIAAGIGIAFAVLGLVFLSLAIVQRGLFPDPASPERTSSDPAAGAAIDGAVVGHGISEPAMVRSSIDAGPYALDTFERRPELATEGCPEVALVDHAGDRVTWQPALRIHPAFLPSVRALEEVIDRTAREVYGRAPERVLSASTYRCRTIRGRPERISEHALGNAVDLRGITVLADGGSREITVRAHWSAGGEDARFLRLLARRVIEGAIFRGVIGPPTRDHLDHFHFDHGPSSYVAIELDGS